MYHNDNSILGVFAVFQELRNIMAKIFDIYFSVRIKGENFSDVTSKMSNIYQNIRNSINNEATLKFVDVELDEVEFSAIRNGGYQRH